MNKINPPTEKEFLAALQTIDIELSQQFQQQMQNQSWFKQESIEMKQMTRKPKNKWKRPYLAAAICLIVILFIGTLPTTRAIAQQATLYFIQLTDIPMPEPWLAVVFDENAPTIHVEYVDNTFVVQTPDDGNWDFSETITDGAQTMTITSRENAPFFIVLDLADAPPIDSLDSYADGQATITIAESDQQIAISIESGTYSTASTLAKDPRPIWTVDTLQKEISFPLRTISQLPQDYRFASVSPVFKAGELAETYNHVVVSYRQFNAPEHMIMLYQERIQADAPPWLVGDTAVIESVALSEDILAEYVQGEWLEPTTNSILDESVWDDTSPKQTLRWQEQDILFTLETTDPNLMQDDLITMAQSLSE